MRRFGFILACMTVLLVAGAAFSQVGHITPVGHVERVELNWETLVSDDVNRNGSWEFRFLDPKEGPGRVEDLGILALPEDKTYVLTLLGGIDATKGTIEVGDVSLGTAMVDALEGKIEAKGQNMLLFYNRDTGKWDGIASSEFSIQENSSYDIESDNAGIHARIVSAKATEVTSGGGGGGGGCTAAFLSPAALFLLAPLFLLKRRN